MYALVQLIYTWGMYIHVHVHTYIHTSVVEEALIHLGGGLVGGMDPRAHF